MRRVLKDESSKIFTYRLKYIPNNSTNNKKISDVLLEEQRGFYTYTDEFIGRTDARDIDHFDPTLKGTLNDNQNNWFLVKHQWNKEKANKWLNFQPILHPCSPDFQERIVYKSGEYIARQASDTAAINLIEVLKLNDPGLSMNQKKVRQEKMG